MSERLRTPDGRFAPEPSLDSDGNPDGGDTVREVNGAAVTFDRYGNPDGGDTVREVNGAAVTLDRYGNPVPDA